MDNEEVDNLFNQNIIMASEFIRKFLDDTIKYKAEVAGFMVTSVASMMGFTINKVTEKLSDEINVDGEKVFLMILDSFQKHISFMKREITSKKLS